jgi:inosine/xanthosine triphosphatase
MKVAVCSKNPVKIEAATEAFCSYFDEINLTSIEMTNNKDVKSQPMTSHETLNSAVKRVQIARERIDADFYVSMEGGMNCDDFGAFLTWYVCVGNNLGEISIAGGGRMPLPKKIYNELKNNIETELGDIMDRVTKEENIKQKGGSTAVFTGNRIQRKDVFKREIIMALIPFTSTIYQQIKNER